MRFFKDIKAWSPLALSVLSLNAISQSASWNYTTATGSNGTTYSWIDCSGGTSITSGDDTRGSINWPFAFSVYDDSYTTSNSISCGTNGFIRFDGNASTSVATANAYMLGSTSTELGQIVAVGVYDAKVGDNGGYCNYLVTGSAPNRVLTIEYNNLEVDYNDNKYGDVQVQFYETTNVIVILKGSENVGKNGVDMGIHSGVDTYYHDWTDLKLNGTQDTWMEYTPVPLGFIWKTTASTTDWNTGSNWESGSVPTSSDDVEIPTGCSNYPNIDETNAVCADINIQSGGKIDFASGGKLTVSGATTLDNGGLLQFDGGEMECTGKFDWDGLIDFNSGTLDVNNEVELSATASEQISGGTIECSGEWDGNAAGGNFTPTGGTVKLNGSALTSLDCDASDNFYNLVIDKSSNGLDVGNDLDVNGELRISQGDLDLSIAAGSSDYDLGTGTSTTNQYSPYKSWWDDSRSQLLFTAAELSAAGLAAGDEISGLAFNISSKNSTQPYSGWEIKMAHTASTSISAFENPTWTIVHNSAPTTATGWNSYTFSTNFTWNGTSNVIIETCHDNPDNSYDGADDYVYYTTTGSNSAVMGYAYGGGENGCGVTMDAAGTNRANTRFTVTTAAGGYDIELVGNWTNNGTFTQGKSNITMDGAIVQTITGSTATTFYDMTLTNTVTNAEAVQLGSNITIENDLNMSMTGGGDVNLNGMTLTIGSDGSINGESNSDRIYGTSGKISHTIDMSANSTLYDIAGMGLTLTTGAGNVPGSTLIERAHDAQTGAGNTGIERYFMITPTTNTSLGITMKFEYFAEELNGQTSDDDMYLWRSTDNGSTWMGQPSNWTDDTDDYLTLTNIDAFSWWTASRLSSDALPVELLTFNATLNNDVVELVWETAVEIDNDYFTIERSADGIEWQDIMEVAGAGNSTDINNYFELDFSPLDGKSFYRLKQTDYNGESKYSNIVPIMKGNENGNDLELFPNPSDGNHFFVGVNGFEGEDVLIVLRDINGREIYSKLKMANDNNLQPIDLDNRLATGTYLIIASSDQSLVSKKLLVK